MKALLIGSAENLNGSSANGNRHITRGAVVRLFNGKEWESGTVEQVMRTRFRGDIRDEYQVRLSNGDGLAYFLAEDFAPATTERAVPSLWSAWLNWPDHASRHNAARTAISWQQVSPGRAFRAAGRS